MAELILLGFWVSCPISDLGLNQKPVSRTDNAAEGLHSTKNKMLSHLEGRRGSTVSLHVTERDAARMSWGFWSRPEGSRPPVSEASAARAGIEPLELRNKR